ncbi:glucose facilitated diffusion protein [Drosophila gunungcola]|uniref:glucose facilitated diffusion protein n=1 Tax=Drosophila gunungcola TaxID=103775 RepID=UPI0022E56EED|nr:glucose facilitated diffusion protein [Drosophila gunungcola]
MSGKQTTNVEADPLPQKEVIILATAAPPERPEAAVTTNNTGYFSRVNRNKNASYAVFFLLVYGGMDMAASLGWNQTYSVFLITEYSYCWFIGVIIGALAVILTMSFLPKQVFYFLGGILQLTGSILFTAMPGNYGACLGARYLAGLGIGLITVPFLIHNAEVAATNVRGVCGGMEQIGLALGIEVQVVFTTEWASILGTSPNLVHGIIGIVFSLLGLGMTALTIESPIYYLRRNQESLARQCLQKLMGNSPNGVTRALDEAKLYVAESDSQSLGEELVASVGPFLKLLLFRCFVAFSFSLPLTMSIISSTAVAEGALSVWPMYVFGSVRLISALVALCLLDTLGRKAVSLVGLLCMAGLMLGLAALYADMANIVAWKPMVQACNIGMAFQAVAGLFVCSSSAYMGEAFPMRVKSTLVGLIVIVEQLIHVIVLACLSSMSSGEIFFPYFLSVGIIMLLGMIFFAVSMPETKKITLREAGHRFQRWFDLSFY